MGKKEGSRGISIINKGQKWFLAVSDEGIITFDALKKCFPTATSLYYLRDTGSEIVNEILTVHNDCLSIPDTSQIYYPYIPQGYENVMNLKKTARVENMIKNLKDSKLQRNKNVEVVAKACIKSADSNDKNSNEEDVKFKNDRKATIIWKHRESEQGVFKPNSAFHYRDKIALSASKDYSLRELTDESVKIFSSPTTKWFFDNCTINIGIGSDRIVTRFADKDGSSCTFWEYSRLFRDNGGRLSIYLLTTSNSLLNLHSHVSVIDTVISSKNVNLKRKLSENNQSAGLPVKRYTANAEENVKRQQDLDKKILKDKTSFELNYPAVQFSSISKNPKPSKTIQSPKSIPSSSFRLALKGNTICSTSKVNPPRNQATSTPVSSVKKKILSTPSKTYDENTSEKTGGSEIEIRLPQVNPYELEIMSTILGQGGQGTVCLGKWKNTKVAIKRIRMKTDNLLLKREILMMERVRHENFVNIMAVAFDTTHASLVMEYFDSRSLWDCIFKSKVKKVIPLSDELKNEVGLQLCNGIDYLHNTLDNYIIHGDIKPANILINQYGQVKICDLGLAKCNIMQDELQTQENIQFVRGTSMYMAPELLRKKLKPSRSSDVWAVGCTLLEMYNEESVWMVQKGSVVVDIINHMINDKIPMFKNVPLFVSDNLKKCFEYDLEKRIDIGTLLDVYRDEKSYRDYKHDSGSSVQT